MKKKVISLLLVIVMTTLFVFIFTYNNNSYEYSLKNKDNIAVMVYDETTSNYVKQSSIPIGDYTLNTTLSYCDGSSYIDSYDNSLGKVVTYLNGADGCYFYFDLFYPLLSDEIVQKSNQTSSQTDGGTWAIANEGGGLRYQGKDPNNYVCFSSSCDDSTLYRIIGKFDVMVDIDNDGVSDVSKNAIKIIKSKALADGIYWHTSRVSNWANSSLNSYLNSTWVRPTNDILTATWYVQGGTESMTAEGFLTNETSGTSWDGKVGLMYVSDYGYAVPSSTCARTTAMNNFGSCYTNDWLFYGSEDIATYSNYFWTISPYGCSGCNKENALFVGPDGKVYRIYVDYPQLGVKPVFYLETSTVSFSSGNGSKTNPYIIN